MKSNLTNDQSLWSLIDEKCLKLRHSSLVLVILSTLFTSCGKVINAKSDVEAFNRNINFLLMENQCNDLSPKDSKISDLIKNLFFTTKQNSPQLFYFINPRFYESNNPLVLSLEKLEKDYETIRSNPLSNQNGDELYYLYNGSRRFEDQKCSFSSLAQKKKYDMRSFLNITAECSKKYHSESCDESEYQDMSSEKELWTKNNAVNLCTSFSSKINCSTEFKVNNQKKSIGNMITYYSAKFKAERYEPLFKLRPNHQTFNCKKMTENGEEKTVMTVKVLDATFNHDLLVELKSYVEMSWTKNNFALNIELVNSFSKDVITIVPTNKGISYVPDNNNRTVYLSTVNDSLTMKRVLAHEFGHVLGFPDCYIEFFDEDKKELIYYELDKESSNIMCSLKNDVHVPDDYFSQLSQNSCFFN